MQYCLLGRYLNPAVEERTAPVPIKAMTQRDNYVNVHIFLKNYQQNDMYICFKNRVYQMTI